MKTTDWYKDANDKMREILLRQLSQLWQSYLMVQNREKDTYGDLLDHLRKQYALGTNQFPKSTTSAADVMGAHEIQKGQAKPKTNKNGKKEKLKIIISQTVQEGMETPTGTEAEIQVEMVTKPVFARIERLFVTCVVTKVTWLQSANSKTKSHLMIGTSTSSKELNPKDSTNNINPIRRAMLIKSKRKYKKISRKGGVRSRQRNIVESVTINRRT